MNQKASIESILLSLTDVDRMKMILLDEVELNMFYKMRLFNYEEHLKFLSRTSQEPVLNTIFNENDKIKKRMMKLC